MYYYDCGRNTKTNVKEGREACAECGGTHLTPERAVVSPRSPAPTTPYRKPARLRHPRSPNSSVRKGQEEK